jgi:hypothetical protein
MFCISFFSSRALTRLYNSAIVSFRFREEGGEGEEVEGDAFRWWWKEFWL